MMFPRLVFKDKGPHSRAGGSYSHMQVECEADFKAAIKAGWFATLPEAIEGVSAEEDNAPATRAELEKMAAEIGIKVDGRWSDRKLNDLITEALG